MKKAILIFLLLVIVATGNTIKAQEVKKDTVYTGVYINSIHDIDFKQKEFAISFWLWLKYKNRNFDFANNLEVPSAKSVDKAFSP
jgi:hypothetical protein